MGRGGGFDGQPEGGLGGERSETGGCMGDHYFFFPMFPRETVKKPQLFFIFLTFHKQQF